MTIQYFHGTDKFYDKLLPKGVYVSKSKSNVVYFAQRRGQQDRFIYTVLMDPAKDDLEQRVDPAGTVDHVLAKDIPFVKREPLTDQLIAECKAARAAEVDDLL